MMPLSGDLGVPEEWPAAFVRAVHGLAADDRALLVNVVRQLVSIEAEQGPDVAEAALESLILRLRTRTPQRLI